VTQPFAPQFYPPAVVPAGIAGPRNVLYVPLDQALVPSYVTPLDFTTVTGVRLSVTRPDGTTALWVASSLLQVTTQGLIAVYTFATNGLDCTVDGAYKIRPYLKITPDSTYTVPCSTSILQVTVN
jgi:hypothetical protein